MNEVHYTFASPDSCLSDYVYCYSFLEKVNAISNGVIIPNGKVDLLFAKTTGGEMKVVLMGLETTAKEVPKLDIDSFYAISFNLLGIEYILKESIASIVNKGKYIDNNFWNFTADDFSNFNEFCEKIDAKIKTLIPDKIDLRKQKLFNLLNQTNGDIKIQDVAKEIGWGERQINRYFTKYFGLPLKAYCTILRFQASLPHIHKGTIAPQLNFTDQSHFIKDVKKLTGVSPKELSKNEDDRFLQFLVYDAQ